MKNTLTKTQVLLRVFLLFSLLTGANISYGQFNQKLISECWAKTGGAGLAYKNVTITDASRNVYVAGATMSGANNSDIIVQKFNESGTLTWEKTYAGTAGMNDAATAIFVDLSSNVYVTGFVVNSVTNDQDLIVLKYNSSGVLQWNYTFDAGSSLYKQDVGTSIVAKSTGTKIYVTGTSGNNSTMFDFRTICLTSTGTLSWTQTYDYNALVDIPKMVMIKGANVVVVGASQDSGTPTHWEMATVSYHSETGALKSVARSTSSTVTGINEINDIAVDHATGDSYIIGSIENPTTGYDIAVYKLDSTLNLLWTNYYDINGMDDKGAGITVVAGKAYLTGYSTKSGLGKETLLMKLTSTGSVVWKREISGSKGLDDKGEHIRADASNRLYVASSVNDGNNLDYKLYCYDIDGNFLAAASYNGANNLNDVPQAIEIDLENNVIVTGYEQTGPTTYITKTVKYAFFDRSYDYAYNGTEPTHLKGKILVSFKPKTMSAKAINSRTFYAGQLSDFVDGATLAAIQLKTGSDWSRYKTYKVFKRMTPADSLSVTRLGDTIKAVDFWTYLSIDIPKTWNVYAMCDSLGLLNNYIKVAYPDVLSKLYGTPNDQLFSTGQLGLYDNPTYPDGDINAKDAWDIEVGRSNVKVGIMDAPINWAHEEFNNGTQNLPDATRKIGGGFNYYNGNEIQLYDHNTSYAHGTAVAGIVGAKRNNYTPGNDTYANGIAGIAGGDMGQGNFGVQLFSLGISMSQSDFSPMEVIAEALHDAYSNSPSNPHDFGLNIINGSWGTTNNPYFLIHDEIEECWRNHCIYVAARGDFAPGGATFKTYPSCYEDVMLINAIASGTDGKNKISGINANGSGSWNSNYGIAGGPGASGCPADIMAPGVVELVSSTSTSSPVPNNSTYATFSGTSAAAPHITGVAALMYSKHQENNGYPNKLATEDIERVIEKTASGGGTFNLETGYGLLNANEAVKKVSNPYYIKHLTSTPTLTETSNLTITLYTNTQVTYTGCKKVILNWDVDVILPAGHEIIDWWEFEAGTTKGRPNTPSSNPPNSLSVGVGGTYITTNTIFNPIGGNHVHKTASTMTYYINAPNGGFWYPMPPSEMKYQFSVHVKKSANAGIEELENTSNFILYPNPSNQNITIKSKTGQQISSYTIIDATGRIVATENKINGNEFTLNVVPLTQGIYYCKVFSENSMETIPFIKSKE